MHIARIETRSLDETAEAVDLGQSSAELVFLSFADSDLSALAGAYRRMPEPRPSLRLANLSALRHPYSVDLYLERVVAKAKFVLVRLLGGMEYWRYGVEELSRLARQNKIKLAFVPGDRFDDARLVEHSTLEGETLAALWRYFEHGGPANMVDCLGLANSEAAARATPVQGFGLYDSSASPSAEQSGAAPRALVVFYRSIYLADDLAPIDALVSALRRRGFATTAAYVTSLKDEAARAPLKALIARDGFDIILNATAFSARRDEDADGVLDAADAPVLQVVLASASPDAWAASTRGLSPSDLAMNVALPEVDGRILTRAISFKQSQERDEDLQFARVFHTPAQDRVDYVADLAAAWARLRLRARGERRLACVLSDYPARGGRVGYAVGLDTPASVAAIAEDLAAAGYDVKPVDATNLIEHLSQGGAAPVVALDDYKKVFARMPRAFRASVAAAWGEPEADPALVDGAFAFRFARVGKLVVAVQPDRGRFDVRKGEYHDLTLAPRHAYVAFYIWLREIERIDALIHLGAHGSLEWLPGKAVALSRDCAVEATLGAVPVVYPFIVNNPGEAAQAKRRLGAVTIGHMTPPLIEAGAEGATRELEYLFDEFSEAQSLDPRRARLIADLILERAEAAGLMSECGAEGADVSTQLQKLDAWLCELKDMRIGDGLHVFGRSLAGDLEACGEAEMAGLLKALDGRFVAPGPAGAPSRGRLDVLPTGRNLYAVDPRATPTRNAYEIGRRAAEEVVARYVQDRGEWPRRIALDLWGSASMRTGGEEIAQAFAFIGVRPKWDHAANRVNAFEVLPIALLGRPRIDVTIRISGLFRDVFPAQIALLDAAFRAVAEQPETPEENPLIGVAGARIFGAAPGSYGLGLGGMLASGDWSEREELARAYLAATDHAFDGVGEGRVAPEEFATRLEATDAFVHSQDMAEQDLLGADAFAEHEGGVAAAAASRGARPEIYHLDASRPDRPTVRPLRQEIARVLRARAINPRWLAGQMRHGHRGASEIAETLDNLFAYAALTDAVDTRQFDLYFDATLGDDAMREFLISANPLAARAMARKFVEAHRRGFWVTRRNSSAEILAHLIGEAA